MRKNVTYQLLAAFALATSLVQADKITLKGGKIIEGEVISETATEYVISVAYSKSIRTRKTFKKSEIIHIEKEAPDLAPYEALKGILPTRDQLSATAYEQVIEAKVKPFIANYPDSRYLKEVKKTLETLEAELARVKAGDIKLDGKWIAAADWNADALELDGQILVKKMRTLAARRAYRPALLVYDKINKEFRATNASNDAAQIAMQFLPTYGKQIKKLAAESTDKLAKREKALRAMTPRDATRMKKAYAETEAKHSAAVAAAKESRTKWLPVSELNTKDLKSLATIIDAEIGSIKRQGMRSVRDASTSEIYRKGWAAASAGNVEDVKRAQANLRSRRIDDKYLQLISDQLAANPAAPKETGPTAEELRAAAAAEKAAKDKAEAEAKKKAEEEAKAERRRKAQEAQEAAEEEPEEKSSSSIFPIIVAVALLGILITFLVIKRKESEE